MKAPFYLSIIFLIINITACGTNKSLDPEFKYDRIGNTQIIDTVPIKEISPVNFPVTNNVVPAKINPPHGQPGHICGNDAGAMNAASPNLSQSSQTGKVSPTASTPGTNANDKSVNPAHGQPGHRCDIAVGASLNSKPALAPIQQQNTNAVIPVTPKVNTADKNVNPPHGQPGHRCDVSASSTQNSKPSITQLQPAVINTNSTDAASKWGASLNNNSTPSLQQNQPVTAAKTTVSPGMNPKHGEPGHRCDISVGTPLNQPVKKDSAKN